MLKCGQAVPVVRGYARHDALNACGGAGWCGRDGKVVRMPIGMHEGGLYTRGVAQALHADVCMAGGAAQADCLGECVVDHGVDGRNECIGAGGGCQAVVHVHVIGAEQNGYMRVGVQGWHVVVVVAAFGDGDGGIVAETIQDDDHALVIRGLTIFIILTILVVLTILIILAAWLTVRIVLTAWLIVVVLVVLEQAVCCEVCTGKVEQFGQQSEEQHRGYIRIADKDARTYHCQCIAEMLRWSYT